MYHKPQRISQTHSKVFTLAWTQVAIRLVSKLALEGANALCALGRGFQPVQETALGFKIIRGRAAKTPLLSLGEFDLQRRHDLLCHFILQRENVL